MYLSCYTHTQTQSTYERTHIGTYVHTYTCICFSNSCRSPDLLAEGPALRSGLLMALRSGSELMVAHQSKRGFFALQSPCRTQRVVPFGRFPIDRKHGTWTVPPVAVT